MESAQALKAPKPSQEVVEDGEPQLEPTLELVGDKNHDATAKNLWWQTYVEPQKPVARYSGGEVGQRGEALACRYLNRRGYEVVEQNWRVNVGEVDIIARDEHGETVLVEVKTRLSLDADSQALPELAVNDEKQKRYRKLALIYLMLHPNVRSLRFDVIAINIQAEHSARLRHLVGAFSWDS